MKGLGPKTIWALSLVSEIVYCDAPRYRDPEMFSSANRGKDGSPFPVNKRAYDRTIDIMKMAIATARAGNSVKTGVLRSLGTFYSL